MNNTVELIGYYGSDETIALSAWTSTSRDLDEDKRARIPKLIKQLWNAEPVPHGTPFEKGIVHFLVTSEIASHIHLLKHRISSINAECLEKSTLISFENINGGISKNIPIEAPKNFRTMPISTALRVSDLISKTSFLILMILIQSSSITISQLFVPNNVWMIFFSKTTTIAFFFNVSNECPSKSMLQFITIFSFSNQMRLKNQNFTFYRLASSTAIFGNVCGKSERNRS